MDHVIDYRIDQKNVIGMYVGNRLKKGRIYLEERYREVLRGGEAVLRER